MGKQLGARADSDTASNDAVGTDFGFRRDVGVWINDRCRVNRHPLRVSRTFRPSAAREPVVAELSTVPRYGL